MIRTGQIGLETVQRPGLHCFSRQGVPKPHGLGKEGTFMNSSFRVRHKETQGMTSSPQRCWSQVALRGNVDKIVYDFIHHADLSTVSTSLE